MSPRLRREKDRGDLEEVFNHEKYTRACLLLSPQYADTSRLQLLGVIKHDLSWPYMAEVVICFASSRLRRRTVIKASNEKNRAAGGNWLDVKKSHSTESGRRVELAQPLLNRTNGKGGRNKVSETARGYKGQLKIHLSLCLEKILRPLAPCPDKRKFPLHGLRN